jgi:hypothetical protein
MENEKGSLPAKGSRQNRFTFLSADRSRLAALLGS